MTSHSLFAKSERRNSRSSSSSNNSHSRTAHSNHRRPSSSRHPKSMYIPQALFNTELMPPSVLTPRNELLGKDHTPEDSNNDVIIANTMMMPSHLMPTLRHDVIINNNNNIHTNLRFVEPHTIREKFCKQSAAAEPKPTTLSSASCLSSTLSRKRSGTSVLSDALSVLKVGPHHQVSEDESGGIDVFTRSNSETMDSIVSLCTSLSSPSSSIFRSSSTRTITATFRRPRSGKRTKRRQHQ